MTKKLSATEKQELRLRHLFFNFLRANGLYGKFLHNCRNSPYSSSGKFHTLQSENVENWIMLGFDWLESPEGAAFWSEIYSAVLELILFNSLRRVK